MSTVGSAPETAALTPPAAKAKPPKKVGIFRWKAILPLLFVLALVIGGWLLFGNLLVKRALRASIESAMGAEVDIGSVHVGFFPPSFEIRDFALASTKDSMRNAIQFKRFRILVQGAPLLQKKLVIRDVSADSMVAMARRKTPAKKIPPSPPNPYVASALKAAEGFATGVKLQALSLVPLDSIKALVLDPGQLQTVQTARALAVRADSFKNGLPARFNALHLGEVADSAEALVNRLKGKDPRTLGIQGTRTAVNDIKSFAARVDATKRSLDAMQKSVRADADSLVSGVRAIDEARQADYDMAKGLLKLPTFDAPNIGPALFGSEAMGAFQRAVYYTDLARKYTPPGLLPKKSPGPKRRRAPGTTVHFVKQAGVPRFLLQHAAFDLAVDSSAGAIRGKYSMRVGDVTTDPVLTGKPTVFSISRTTTGSSLDSLLIVGAMDHTTSRQTETIVAKAGGVGLPDFAVPSVPLRLNLGVGRGDVRIDLVGDSLRGRIGISAPKATWRADSLRPKKLNTLEGLVVRVLTGIPSIDMAADISGTVKAPKLAVQSNLDRAVADNIKRVAGEEIAKAEAKVRAQVDAFVEKESAPVKAKIAELKTDAEKQIADAQARLDKAKADLNAKLKELSGGLVGG